MVTSPGAQASPDRVRPLNLPRPVQIEPNPRSGLPQALCERGTWRAIVRIQDVWHVDDEWWREPIARRYLQVVLSDGTLRTIFHDRGSDRWFAQSY